MLLHAKHEKQEQTFTLETSHVLLLSWTGSLSASQVATSPTASSKVPPSAGKCQ